MLITVDDILRVIENNPKTYKWYIHDRYTETTREVNNFRLAPDMLVLCDDGEKIMDSKDVFKAVRHVHLDTIVKVGLFDYQYKHYVIFYHEKHIRDIVIQDKKIILIIDSAERRWGR